MLERVIGAIGRTDGLAAYVVRRAFTESRHLGLKTLIDTSALKRPHYAYCMYQAADLARRLGLKRITAIEFGVAGGNGLLYMERLGERIRSELGVEFDLIGFDNEVGLPPPQDVRDLPHWFATGQYRMDRAALERRLEKSRLVLGNVDATVPAFLEGDDCAPIGMIAFDLDLYSSTMSALRIVKGRPELLLPRLFLYFDDVIGTPIEMYGPFNGPELAIDEFNANNQTRKIALNRNLSRLSSSRAWAQQIYYGHIFDHPRYSDYVGEGDQQNIIDHLKLG